MLMAMPALPPSPRGGYTARDDYARLHGFARDETKRRIDAVQKLQAFYRKQRFTHRRANPVMSTSLESDGARAGEDVLMIPAARSNLQSSLRRSIERDEL